jgi:hypothetical protein
MGKSQAQAYERRYGLNRTTHALPYGYICGIQRDKCLRGRVAAEVYAVSFVALSDKSRTVSRDILGWPYGVSGVILGMLGILMNNWVSFVIGINQKIRLISSLARPETCSMLKLKLLKVLPVLRPSYIYKGYPANVSSAIDAL